MSMGGKGKGEEKKEKGEKRNEKKKERKKGEKQRKKGGGGGGGGGRKSHGRLNQGPVEDMAEILIHCIAFPLVSRV